MIKFDEFDVRNTRETYYMERAKRSENFPENHSDCGAYVTYDSEAMAEPVSLTTGETLRYKASRYEIVFVLTGDVKLSRYGFADLQIPARSFFMLPPAVEVTYTAEKTATMFFCRLKYSIGQCKYLSLESVRPYISDLSGHIHALPCRKPLMDFVKGLQSNLNRGLRCEMFLIAKYTELMFLLQAYYSKNELANLCAPIAGHDIGFRTFVYNNIVSVKSVAELAQRYHLTEVGFRKKFKREMGIAPMEYMMDRKKETLYHEIVHGSKPFKVICQEYGINSQSNLNTFCQRSFGLSPVAMRRPAGSSKG